MITIQNEHLSATISQRGAELKSLKYKGLEYIYPSEAQIWDKSAPLLFPITGSVNGDTYTHKGVTYHMEKHGFTQESTFAVVENSDTRATFRLTENEGTLAQYPFRFTLDVTYELNENALCVRYTVKNNSDEVMYFSIGAHEAYYTPEGIEKYDVIFDEEVTLNNTVLYGPLVTDLRTRVLTKSRTLALYEKFFATDALVFEGISCRALTLRNRINEKSVHVSFPFAKNLLIWHKPSAPYICIEPWNGIPDRLGNGSELCKKEGIVSLEVGEEYIGEHTVSILNLPSEE